VCRWQNSLSPVADKFLPWADDDKSSSPEEDKSLSSFDDNKLSSQVRGKSLPSRGKPTASRSKARIFRFNFENSSCAVFQRALAIRKEISSRPYAKENNIKLKNVRALYSPDATANILSWWDVKIQSAHLSLQLRELELMHVLLKNVRFFLECFSDASNDSGGSIGTSKPLYIADAVVAVFFFLLIL
jgi:hypothetical protein